MKNIEIETFYNILLKESKTDASARFIVEFLLKWQPDSREMFIEKMIETVDTTRQLTQYNKNNYVIW